jgi:threonylcarbamoyladenosine tRNA methylthiotransferase MtaB
MRVYFSNLGCKLNQAELEGLAREFNAAGHTIARSLARADLHIVNTCTVTHAAARDSRKVARRGLRLNPRIKTVLTGCYVSEDAGRAAALAGVDLVVANHEKRDLLGKVEAAFPEARPLGVPAGAATPVPYVPLDFGNARALVKVEDGCNMRCSFCIIPKTRGRQVSRPLDEVVREVGDLAAGGFREVVLTGVQISAYRDPGMGLYELVRALLERTAVARLRLTSIAPWQFDRRLLDLFATGRLCRHFHLSLQSGCDATLARMRRPYTVAAFEALADEIRRRVPGVAITTDVIVGFPGETDEEFAASLATVRRLRFARIHAFPYSSRPGTEAARLPDPVDARTAKERMRHMLGAAETARAAFQRQHVGREAEVLWEEEREGVWHGTTDNYLPVTVSSRRDLRRVLAPARLLAASGFALAAELTGSAA